MSFFSIKTVPSKADLTELFALSKHDWDKGCALPLSLIRVKLPPKQATPEACWFSFFPQRYLQFGIFCIKHLLLLILNIHMEKKTYKKDTICIFRDAGRVCCWALLKTQNCIYSKCLIGLCLKSSIFSVTH